MQNYYKFLISDSVRGVWSNNYVNDKSILSRKMFGFNNTPEVIVIMLGARWIVKNIKFTKFYT